MPTLNLGDNEMLANVYPLFHLSLTPFKLAKNWC